ncbi:4-hydroxy-3-methylbut-2-enyl diphosphate reductase [Mediterraneibacter butyricigenes]|uniref:4-hydroxy-3-methylbut-2-enyl diphosphate reductase n=1 Tax=Mediterraneibacter butyricigenes TaxID=2316025 RepID=A0A391PGL4_9FIRM|nr:4-hydroxy-3-methylbut-2-enyl diphosphate reductase [Mediterraneibacter butyricigenes]RGO28059.1 4-hydroxy-3-methylbut-2-enyl diphosphate reductase [Dorea sp. OM02-2LB]RGV97344.1 4-hydroxy-3-methylbut-2-enyl diphosphate reductase [Ruminococcus sp. AF14-10]GCA65702.1 4-hydroxy-3-methylbut-2-enyl diphosphate reductase [Mediterraneibacter butyricigenes]
MEVKLAKTAGFCFGVKRAVDTVYRQIEKEQSDVEDEKKIYTYGPIIHNEEVIKDLEKKGVQVLRTEDALDGISEGTVIIRSHGVEKRIYDKMEAKGLEIVDATCPFVKKIHNIVEKESREGKHIVIIGSEDHPEVIGIKGWVNGPVTVLKTEEEACTFEVEDNASVCVVAQTTFNYNKFKELVEIIEKKSYDISVLNTICGATKERQTEAKSIAEAVDAMIVIGDKHSSNTQKLFEICRGACADTYYIQTLDDLNMNQLRSVETVGITAGASTPNNIIEEVQNNVRIIF